jgi:hypothetical protein
MKNLKMFKGWKVWSFKGSRTAWEQEHRGIEQSKKGSIPFEAGEIDRENGVTVQIQKCIVIPIVKKKTKQR